MNRILKKAIRIILKMRFNESVKELSLKILTVYGQYISDSIMFVRPALDFTEGKQLFIQH